MSLVIPGTPVAVTDRYVTAAQLRLYKVSGRYITDLNLYTDDELNVEIDLAQAIIDTLTNNWFNLRAKTILYDGNGTTRLFFFPEIPAPNSSVTSVKEVKEDGTVLETWAENTDFVVHEHYMERILGADNRPRLETSFTGSRWPRGQNNIRVEGIFGQNDGEVPPAIVRATELLALERLIPGSTGIAPSDIVQAVWSDFTVTYRAATPENRIGMSTGFDAVDMLLQPWVNRVDMFMVIPDVKTQFDEFTL